ncbi:hypothetical protein BSKO_01039 [Bryopsis sp. KO-2023]|nr:hypothetical protein BSKO_01039 [Bryopsis sp. KO-2023]
MAYVLSRLVRNPPIGFRAGLFSQNPRSSVFNFPGVGETSARKASMTAGENTQEVMRAVEERLGKFDASPTLPKAPGLVVLICGPSGVGKDSVIRRLQEQRPELQFVVTATSRPMRPGEVDGVDYIFVTKEKFEEWISNGEMLEHAIVYGEYKGIPKKQVTDALAKGTDVILRVDVQGSATVKSIMPEIVSIFLTAGSEAELVQRLVGRKTEDLDKLTVRIKTAQEELARIGEFDYAVVNAQGKMEETVSKLSAIIDVEKMRLTRWLNHKTDS